MQPEFATDFSTDMSLRPSDWHDWQGASTIYWKRSHYHQTILRADLAGCQTYRKTKTEIQLCFTSFMSFTYINYLKYAVELSSFNNINNTQKKSSYRRMMYRLRPQWFTSYSKRSYIGDHMGSYYFDLRIVTAQFDGFLILTYFNLYCCWNRSLLVIQAESLWFHRSFSFTLLELHGIPRLGVQWINWICSVGLLYPEG